MMLDMMSLTSIVHERLPWRMSILHGDARCGKCEACMNEIVGVMSESDMCGGDSAEERVTAENGGP